MTSGDLPAGWEWATLPELVGGDGVFTDGDWVESKDQDPSGEVRLIQLADIGDGEFRNRSDRSLTLEKSQKLGCTLLKAGDILISRMADPLGRACLFPGDDRLCATVVDACIIRPGASGNVDTYWLMNFINSPPFRSQIGSQASGTTRGRISRGNLGLLRLPVPPLAEQRRIANKLEALRGRSRGLRESLQSIDPLLEQFRQSVLAAAFRGDLTADWRAANPDVGSASTLLSRVRQERRKRWEAAEMIKMAGKGKTPSDDKWKERYEEPPPADSVDLPLLPEGWSWSTLEAITPAEHAIVYGIIQPGPHVPDGVPFIRPADIELGTVNLTELPRTSVEIAADYARASLEPGDLVFSIVGTIGKWLIVPAELRGANITQSSVRIRPAAPFTPEFVLYALLSPQLSRQMELLKFGNAVQRLNVDHVRKLRVPVPPESEMTAISTRISESFSRIANVAQTLQGARSQLASLDEALLAKAFRGELVPQDPSDEPASVLLARVRAARLATEANGTGRRSRRSARGQVANGGGELDAQAKAEAEANAAINGQVGGPQRRVGP